VSRTQVGQRPWMVVPVVLMTGGLLLSACSSTDSTSQDQPSSSSSATVSQDGPLTDEAAVAELRAIFDKYAVDGQLCKEQIEAIADDEYARLNTSGNGIPADDANNPYSTYDESNDGLISEQEFEAGEYAAAQKNVDTDGSGCVTFEELKKYQDL
jgi:hypothetical protein